MMNKKEMTAPGVSVGADTEQSSKTYNTGIIPNENENINGFDENYQDLEQEILQMTDPTYLKTVTLNKLYETTYLDSPPIIENLLYPGTYIFSGSPKVGKSFLMAQLAYHISTGIPLWDHPVRKGTVLYLALEDNYSRLQKRLYRMVGGEGNDNLHFAIASGKLGSGLEEQLNRFLDEHSDTRLVIIDTLIKIRDDMDDKYSYAADYKVISQLKTFSDSRSICLLLVHHTRKEKAADIFEMISGTNGLGGAADGSFVLYKDTRISSNATLEIVGRDQPEQKLKVSRDPEKLCWNLDEIETDPYKEPPEPVLEMVAQKITPDNPSWEGSPTSLAQWLEVDMKPNTLSLKLNIFASRLMNEHRILYKNVRTHEGRRITLVLQPDLV